MVTNQPSLRVLLFLIGKLMNAAGETEPSSSRCKNTVSVAIGDEIWRIMLALRTGNAK
ncbi:unnamed protein product, partial [Amoebophrya sp. A25]|eukprot:GSA25T00003866001.1